MLKKLNKYMSILLKGTSKKNFPFYATFLTSDGTSVFTCNDESFVSLDISLPFEGSIDAYALNGILSRIDVDNAEIVQKKNKLYIDDYKLNLIKNLNIPTVDRLNVKTTKIDNDLLEIISIATSFISNTQPFDVIYLGEFICASDRSNLFYHKTKMDFETYLGKNALSFLKIGKRFGAKDYYLFVELDDGYIITTLPMNINFPIDRAFQLANQVKDVKKICDFGTFKGAYEKFKPLLVKEMVKNILFTDKSLSVKTTIGSSKYDIKPIDKITSHFQLSVPTTLFNIIPDYYDVFIDESNLDKLILMTDDSHILISAM